MVILVNKVAYSPIKCFILSIFHQAVLQKYNIRKSFKFRSNKFELDVKAQTTVGQINC